jgi:hypothetical protein
MNTERTFFLNFMGFLSRMGAEIDGMDGAIDRESFPPFMANLQKTCPILILHAREDVVRGALSMDVM